ncbi:hypothetical protein HRI_003224400 [Hibiscus trionum]|uniref:Uncharacterized protein n=1 Tax=Hibiscus trionum TaxID=183268 RepID=A0A9W7IHX4_HIBTR|nr:hypothetical protein HRI_003224400 [Hibiscus trionum]
MQSWPYGNLSPILMVDMNRTVNAVTYFYFFFLGPNQRVEYTNYYQATYAFFSPKSCNLHRNLSFSFSLLPNNMDRSQAQTHDLKPNKEKPQERKQPQKTQEGKHLVWDCDSNLYDSFELNSFRRQLDSAIHSRTMSMPHLTGTTRAPPPVPKKQPSKFSRSIQKLLKSVFKFRQSSNSSLPWMKQRSNEEYYVVYDKTGSLTTIPEVPEIDFGGLSPEINSLVAKRTASDRFTVPSTVGISCA